MHNVFILETCFFACSVMWTDRTELKRKKWKRRPVNGTGRHASESLWITDWLTGKSRRRRCQRLASTAGRSRFGVSLFCSSQRRVCLVDENETIYGLKCNSSGGETTATSVAVSLMRCNGDGSAELRSLPNDPYRRRLTDLTCRPAGRSVQLSPPHHHPHSHQPVHFTYAFMTSFRRAKWSPSTRQCWSTANHFRTPHVSHTSAKSCETE